MSSSLSVASNSIRHATDPPEQRPEHAFGQQGTERHEKLSDLAAELGFCDQSHFTRLFRRTTGFTPREFARRLQHQFSPQRFGVVAAGPFRGAVNDAEFARRSAVSL
jgi:methylphosphotriester-DNA--protein-cysteine methyltransferase